MSQTICKRCVCDTTIPSIRFNAEGICNYCDIHDRLDARYNNIEENKRRLESLIDNIKSEGAKKEYDCIVGVSGGTDSSYTLHMAKQWGLRPLAVHLDNGWNTDEAVSNIKSLITKLDVDLHTHVVDWEEFKDLQIAFLKASVPCVEGPTDVAIHGTLYRLAEQEGIRFILGGQNYKSEGMVPREWSYLDGTYVQSVHKKFGNVPLETFPNVSLLQIAADTVLRGIRQIPVLNYIDYTKANAKAVLAREYGWKSYSGHHYENIYSRFAFGWYLPKKFGIDKRLISLSGPVRSHHISREAALAELQIAPDVDEKLVDYVIKKLGLTDAEYRDIFALKPLCYKDYFTSASVLKYFKTPMKLAIKMNMFTPVLYEKYFS